MEVNDPQTILCRDVDVSIHHSIYVNTHNHVLVEKNVLLVSSTSFIHVYYVCYLLPAVLYVLAFHRIALLCCCSFLIIERKFSQ